MRNQSITQPRSPWEALVHVVRIVRQYPTLASSPNLSFRLFQRTSEPARQALIKNKLICCSNVLWGPVVEVGKQAVAIFANFRTHFQILFIFIPANVFKLLLVKKYSSLYEAEDWIQRAANSCCLLLAQYTALTQKNGYERCPMFWSLKSPL